MSATPESFLDTMDADVPNEPEQSTPSDTPSIQPADVGDGKSIQPGVAADNADKAIVKDKVDPTKPDDKAEKVVPLRALQEEREQAKELKRQIAELQAQPKLTAEDADLLKELKAQRAAQNAPKNVDFMDDPKGYVDAIDKKAQAALDKLKAATESTTKQVTAAQRFQALQNAVVTSEQSFVKDTPDYFDALAHIRSVRAQQIQLASPNATAEQISNAIAQEEMHAADSILQRGGNPCDFAYKYAKTLGYAKKAASINPKANGMAEAADKSAVRTLGAGGGDAPSGDELDADDPNAEFKAAQAAFRRRR